MKIDELKTTNTIQKEYIWVEGFKGTNADMTCRDFQYELNKKYDMDDKPVLCSKGFHFCKELVHVFIHYDHNFKNRFFKVHALVAKDEWGKSSNKYVAKQIVLVEELELTYEKLMDMGMLKSNSIFNEYSFVYMPKDLFEMQKENPEQDTTLQWYLKRMKEIGHSETFAIIFMENLHSAGWGNYVASFIRAQALFDEGLSKDMQAYMLLQQKSEAEKRRAEHYQTQPYHYSF